MFDTVVLATDGSASAERAVVLGVDFAERFDATLYACYVVDDDDDPDARRAEGQEALANVADRTDDVTTELLEGEPAPEICAYADSVGADLVVTGTRGRNGEHGNLIGSVAEAVVQNSPAPVLTARQLDADEHSDVPVSNEAGE